jgi:hypothetical protein
MLPVFPTHGNFVGFSESDETVDVLQVVSAQKRFLPCRSVVWEIGSGLVAKVWVI